MGRITLRFKLVALSIVVILFLGASLTWVFTKEQGEMIDEQLIRRGESLAAYFSTNCEYGIFSGNTTLLENLSAGALKEAEVEYVAVYDLFGNVLHSKHKLKNNEIPEYPVPLRPESSLVAELTPLVGLDGRRYYDFGAVVFRGSRSLLLPASARPVNTGRDAEARIGFVRIGISREETMSRIMNSRNRAILVTAIIMLVAAGAAYAGSRSLTEPIKKLVRGTEQVAKGVFDQPLEIKSKDEIGELADSFNRMILDLDQYSSQILEYNRNLEERVGERTEALRRANDELTSLNEELRSLDKLKTNFISTVSHELRTPLTSIKGSVALILNGITGEVQPEAREFLEVCHRNTDRLIRLISDLLDLSRIESGRLELRKSTFPVSVVVEQVLAEIRPLANEKSVIMEMDVADSLMLTADRDKIEQILNNLTSNAVKFAPGGKIKIHARMDADVVIISVEDNGAGISPIEQERVFERFTQVDSGPTREHGGTGLGLPICKGLVEEHHGRMWMDSTPGQGSTFYFAIPMESAAEEKPSADSDSIEYIDTGLPSISGGGRRVLVVDDNPDILKVVRRFLEQNGYEVSQARNGRECLARASEISPDVIILDIVLPDFDGYAVMRRLKKDRFLKHIPVVVLSVLPEDNRRGKDHVVEYLSKPLDEQKIIGCMERIFGDLREKKRRVETVAEGCAPSAH